MPIEAPDDADVGKLVGHESSLSNWAGDYVTDMLGKGQAVSELPYQGYDGPLTAGPSDLQTDAFGGIAGLTLPSGYGEAAGMASETYDAAGAAGQYDPLGYNPSNYDPLQTDAGQYDPLSTNPGAGYEPIDYIPGSDYQAGQIGTELWDNQYAEHYMSPYIQEALNPQLEEIRRQAEIQRQIENSQLTQAGAYGGSRSALMNSEMDDNMLRLMAELTGKGYQDAYQSAGNLFTSDYGRDLQAQIANEQAQQYGADLNMEGERLSMQDRQFAASLGMTGAELMERSRQFGANLGLSAEELMERSRQFGSAQGMEGEQMMEQSRQFGADLGLQGIAEQQRAAALLADTTDRGFQAQRDIFGDQLDAGAIQRGITAEGIAADKQQFEEERDFPYKQVQYQHSLLGGMPLATQNYSYGQPSTWSDILSGASQGGGMWDIFSGLFNGNDDGSGSVIDNTSTDDITSGNF